MGKLIAYAYLRVSGQGQITGHGFERQLREIKRFCQSKYRLEKIYKEQISGTISEEKRPVMGTMIADILSNGCDTIIVEDLSRLAREYRIQENILIYLASKKINLVAANTGENITDAIESDPMRKALVQIQGVFGELDKSLLVRKLRKAREKVRREKGRCEGAKIYGTLEGETEILQYIRRLRRKPKSSGKMRMTYRAIAEVLNRDGIKPRKAPLWTPSLVFNVLNPKHGGKR